MKENTKDKLCILFASFLVPLTQVEGLEIKTVSNGQKTFPTA
jgi:hypothetical protein